MTQVIPSEYIENAIFLMRGHKVMLDSTLARLYEVPTKVLNQAVRRNLDRFPEDFMFQLNWEESNFLNSKQIQNSRSQIVTLEQGKNIKYLPYVFIEYGVAMLSSVLKSQRAIHVNIEIMRAFGRLRDMLATHKDLARKLASLEKKYDHQFKIVFDAIRQLMTPPPSGVKKIGFKMS